MVLYAGHDPGGFSLPETAYTFSNEDKIPDQHYTDLCQPVALCCTHRFNTYRSFDLYGIWLYAGSILPSAAVLYAVDVSVLYGMGTVRRGAFGYEPGLSQSGQSSDYGFVLDERHPVRCKRDQDWLVADSFAL